jgi:hypothetical protein
MRALFRLYKTFQFGPQQRREASSTRRPRKQGSRSICCYQKETPNKFNDTSHSCPYLGEKTCPSCNCSDMRTSHKDRHDVLTPLIWSISLSHREMGASCGLCPTGVFLPSFAGNSALCRKPWALDGSPSRNTSDPCVNIRIGAEMHLPSDYILILCNR